jgi:hypothetical protein
MQVFGPRHPLFGLSNRGRAIGGRRYHMHDLEATCFEFLEDVGQCQRSGGVNVMQQQYALAASLYPANRPTRDFVVMEPATFIWFNQRPWRRARCDSRVP